MTVPMLPNVPSVVVDVESHDGPLCVTVESRHPGASSWTTPVEHCSERSDDFLSMRLAPPTTETLYRLRLSRPPRPGNFNVQFDARSSWTAVWPPMAPGVPRPPSNPPYPSCAMRELEALTVCAEDARALKCTGAGPRAEIRCLEERLGVLDQECHEAMVELLECAPSHVRIVPLMTVAFVMLLVTTAFTMACSTLRCCVRRLCIHTAASASPTVSLEDANELSDASDDDDTAAGSNTQQPSTGAGGGGGRTKAKASSATRDADAASAYQLHEDDDADDDDLPGYSQVVEPLPAAPSIIVEPLQTQTASSPDLTANERA